MKITASVKLLVGLVLSFSIAFSCVGFAQLTDNMSFGGDIVVKEQKGVYIYNIEMVDDADVDVNAYISSVLNSTAHLNGNSDDYGVVKITVKNNSDLVYGYSATLRQAGIHDETYSNGDIVYAVYSDEECTVPLAKKTPVQPDGYLDFYLKFYYADNAQIPEGGEELNSILNFKFITPIEDIPETGEKLVIMDTLEKFRIILNTQNEYVDLYNGMQAKYSGKDWHVSYIGNVAGSNHIDTEVLNELFDNILTINVDGVDLNITLIVKMENIDGNGSTGGTYVVPSAAQTTYSGCEMTLYMTAVQIEKEGYNTYEYIRPVYAGVFTCDGEGQPWYQIGDVYAGEAGCVGYVGGYDNDSFDTGTWRTIENYYSTGTGAGISTLMQKKSTSTYDASMVKLKQQISAAEQLSQADYTSESWVKVSSALAIAKTTYTQASNYRNVTHATIIGKARELQRAIDALEYQLH